MGSQKSTRELLEKYWAAETTTEEETQLRAAFAQDDNSAESVYFRFLNAEASRQMSAPVPALHKTRRLRLRRTLSIAAAVLVLVVAGFLIQRSMISDARTVTADSFDDPMEAYEEAKQALLLVSEKLNSSKEMACEKLAKTQPYIEIIK
jgi:hypothetical protein